MFPQWGYVVALVCVLSDVARPVAPQLFYVSKLVVSGKVYKCDPTYRIFKTELLNPLLHHLALHFISLGITADDVTLFGNLVVFFVPVLIYFKRRWILGLIVFMNVFADTLDGEVAQHQGFKSEMGDSVLLETIGMCFLPLVISSSNFSHDSVMLQIKRYLIATCLSLAYGAFVYDGFDNQKLDENHQAYTSIATLMSYGNMQYWYVVVSLLNDSEAFLSLFDQLCEGVLCCYLGCAMVLSPMLDLNVTFKNHPWRWRLLILDVVVACGPFNRSRTEKIVEIVRRAYRERKYTRVLALLAFLVTLSEITLLFNSSGINLV